jgi:hypothetical protein
VKEEFLKNEKLVDGLILVEFVYGDWADWSLFPADWYRGFREMDPEVDIAAYEETWTKRITDMEITEYCQPRDILLNLAAHGLGEEMFETLDGIVSEMRLYKSKDGLWYYNNESEPESSDEEESDEDSDDEESKEKQYYKVSSVMKRDGVTQEEYENKWKEAKAKVTYVTKLSNDDLDDEEEEEEKKKEEKSSSSDEDLVKPANGRGNKKRIYVVDDGSDEEGKDAKAKKTT